MKAAAVRIAGAVRGSAAGHSLANRDDVALRAIPGCLRGGDALAGETMIRGLMRCGHATLDLNRPRPFAALLDAPGFTAYVDQFVWLADLKAAGGPAARATSVRLLQAWSRDRGQTARRDVGATAATTTRLRTCLANGDLLLDDCDLETFDGFNALLARDIAALEAVMEHTSLAANARARASLALVLAGLVLDGCEDLLAAQEAALANALAAAIHPDGSPKSRCRDDAIDLVLDLIPVIRMYSYVERDIPAPLIDARHRLMRFLRTLHISGATFAGFGELIRPADLNIARALKLETHLETHGSCADAGIVRCEAGGMMLLADAGGPWLADVAPAARASIGAIEIAFARRSVITTRQAAHVPAGPPRHGYSTLALQPVNAQRASASSDAMASRGMLTAMESNTESGTHLTLEHDRFLATFGLLHRRSFVLAADGSSLSGVEQLAPESGIVRFARDVPLVVQFQIAANIEARIGQAAGTIALTLPEGVTLMFACEEGQVSLETQTDVAPDGAQRTGLLIAVRTTTNGETRINWRLTVSA